MRFLTAFLLLLALLPAAAQARTHHHDKDSGDWESDQEWLADSSRWRSHDRRESHREVRAVVLPSRPGVLHIDGGRNGGAAVRGEDGAPRATARIQTWGDTREEALAVAREIHVGVEAGVLRAEGPEQEENSHWSVIFNVRVSPRSDLILDAQNGPVAVEGVTGKLDIQSRNGPVSLQRVGGDVSVRLRNGPLAVELEGSKWEGEGLDAETVNGPVSLAVPRGYSAQLETGTVNGPLSSDIPITLRRRGNKHVSVRLGSGGARLRVVTTNGPADIHEID